MLRVRVTPRSPSPFLSLSFHGIRGGVARKCLWVAIEWFLRWATKGFVSANSQTLLVGRAGVVGHIGDTFMAGHAGNRMDPMAGVCDARRNRLADAMRPADIRQASLVTPNREPVSEVRRRKWPTAGRNKKCQTVARGQIDGAPQCGVIGTESTVAVFS